MHKMHNFLGIRCNIWERATKRTLLTHHLASGGQHNVGYVAVPWESILHGKCGSMGRTKYGLCSLTSWVDIFLSTMLNPMQAWTFLRFPKIGVK